MRETDRRALRASGGTGLQRLLAAALAALLFAPSPAGAVELKPQTLEAFDRYVKLSEAHIDAELARRTPFLWVDTLSGARREKADADLRAGRVVVERLKTLDNAQPIVAPGAIIHHWIGTVFVPGASLEQTLALVEDYDHHQDYYRPEVMRSKILARNGNDFRVYLRFYKKKVLTSVLDTEHEIHYEIVDATHAWSRSRSVHIREVENAGKSDERQKPEGNDRGLLWRIYTYWRFEQKGGGTYVECQSISLTRDIPTGLAWLISPFIESIPRESLTFTLGATRTVLLHRATSSAAK
jgi:hypothetical protein